MMLMDIVIPVREALINEELRYTLRSICANFPHEKIWIVGYRPPWLNGDVNFVAGNNAVGNKYPKVLSNHLITAKHPQISEDFYLFNDDFFVLRPVYGFEDFYRCSIDESVERLLKHTNGVESTYLRSLIRTKEILQQMGIRNPMDYGLHIPIRFNKTKWRNAYAAQQKYNLTNSIVHMRTIYGNLYKIANKRMDDVKILDLDREPDPGWNFCSTVDSAFVAGAVGQYIRNRFPNMCKCEGAVANTFMLN